METINTVRGFHDIFGEDLSKFRRVSNTIRDLLHQYNFQEIILPVVEFAELFQRSIGEVTDIVQKEMFVFEDKKGRLLALRPEGTASAVRAYINNKLYAFRPYQKLFYEGPMFRYERPQAGRYRQFHQIGAEIFGTLDPVADAEIISIVYKTLKKLGIDAHIEINSIGCKVCRPRYRQTLVEYLNSVSGELCHVCLERKDKNPLRVLDCKVPTCKEAVKDAPKMIQFLCDECKTHYESLKSLLYTLNIPYVENYNLVRGLDYYTKTVFEAVSEEEDITVIAGGRYDYLVEELGGPPTPAIGFAVGIERLSMLLRETPKDDELYVVIPFGNVVDYALNVSNVLREKRKKVEFSYKKGSLKKQLELANKLGASYVVIIGEDEKEKQVVTIKNMQSGEQRIIKIGDL